jgi:hypothetical protein
MRSGYRTGVYADGTQFNYSISVVQQHPLN